MSFKSSVAEGLLECLARKWTYDNFSDFTVVVEDEEFHCHKFILSACSTFFDGLLRTEMSENLENRAVLRSMSKETFAVIMNAVYKGENCLTAENIIPVWQTTCFLNIDFLIDLCERFVSDNISLTNFEVYYEYAKLLGSKSVVTRSHEFMIHNFQEIKDTKPFFELSADELCNMVDSHFLKVDSEDVVIESILQWINYGHHNSKGLIDEITADSCVDHKYSSQHNEPANKLANTDNRDTDTNEQSIEQSNCTGTNEQSSEQRNYTGTNEQSSEYNNDTGTEEKIIKLTTRDESDIESNDSTAVFRSNKISTSIEVNDKLESLYSSETQTQLLKDRKLSEHIIIGNRKNGELILNDIPERESSILNLLKSAQMFLVSRGCLENLARNSMITSKPEAMNIVYEALMYKYKAVNYRNSIVRYRECSNIVNGVVYMWDCSIMFYDLLNKQKYVLEKLKMKTEDFPEFVGLTAVGTNLCFTTKKVEKLKINSTLIYEDFKVFNLYNMKKQSLSVLHKSQNTSKTFLLNYCECFACVDSSYQNVIVFRNSEKLCVGLYFINSEFSPTYTTIFEDMILIFYKSDEGTGIQKCTPGDENIICLPDIEGPADKITSFQYGKYLYLLQKNGNLWLVTRCHTDEIEFTLIDTLWHIELDLHGSVCYNKTLFIFGEEIKADNESSDIYVEDLQKRSLPGVFDSIKVVNFRCNSQIVPLAVDKTILKSRENI